MEATARTCATLRTDSPAFTTRFRLHSSAGGGKGPPLRLRQVHKSMARALHIGVLGAMPEEIGSDLSHLQQLQSEQHGDLTIHHGSWGETSA